MVGALITSIYYFLKGYGIFYWWYEGCNPCTIFVHWFGQDFKFKVCDFTGCTPPFGRPGYTLPTFL